MINVERTDPPVGGALMVRFSRTKMAVGTAVVAIGIFLGPWIAAPFVGNDSGLSDLTLSLAVFVISAILFGWYLVLLAITARRGGSLALTPAGVLVQPGLGSVLIPWTAISGASVGDDGSNARNPVLRLQLRAGHKVPGWPWPIALQPALLGSSKHRLRILVWWFVPFPVDRLVAIIRFLVRHPEERSRIGTVDPAVWEVGRDGRAPRSL